MGTNGKEMLKAGEMFEIDKLTDEVKNSRIAQHFSKWVKDCRDLNAGSIGGAGYDLGCGRYLKLPLQDAIDGATCQALKDKQTTYWDHCPELPVTLAAKLKEENNLEVEPGTELCLTCGILSLIHI